MITSASGAVPPPDARLLSLAELRTLRRTAHREEADLSYVRRLVQGRIDILLAEQRRRRSEAGGSGPLADRLARILADGPPPQRSSARHVTLTPPVSEEYRRLAEQILAEVQLSDLSALDDLQLRRALARLARHESRISRRRQELHRTADECGAEIARRYREGQVRVDDLLGHAAQGGPAEGTENAVTPEKP
ncbi:aerial mycelium formation protein [Streptomyces sp. 7-21]|jgi:hypothetical protein|uniref:RsiG family protein n=1 Tax=Streptomyces sp. 7-21 TaxID=2802283 RepID=UPI00191D429E|nr:aerial mycelium formation protein [Streptomyces sp. 7-21]MBL1068538.1 aerial mycelium formation protein [Streptomyces sp. 7-21]